jgi:hypothetical protein
MEAILSDPWVVYKMVCALCHCIPDKIFAEILFVFLFVCHRGRVPYKGFTPPSPIDTDTCMIFFSGEFEMFHPYGNRHRFRL